MSNTNTSLPQVKVVVTGGAGFIGANLCRLLASHDSVAEVVALDNLSNGRVENLDGIDAELVTRMSNCQLDECRISIRHVEL